MNYFILVVLASFSASTHSLDTPVNAINTPINAINAINTKTSAGDLGAGSKCNDSLPGQGCQAGLKCKISPFNRINPDSQEGVCTIPLALGVKCHPSFQVCADGLTCRVPKHSKADEGICAKVVKAGETCNHAKFGGALCEFGYYCWTNKSIDKTGHCVKLGKMGEVCAPTFSLGSHCRSGLACVAGICTPLPARKGQKCLSRRVECEKGLFCAAPRPGLTGRCYEIIPVGEHCPVTNPKSTGRMCALGAECRGGVCQQMKKLGEECTSSSGLCGKGLFCRFGKCEKSYE